MKKFKESLLNEIKKHGKELAEYYLDHSRDGNFICPICGNGSGESGTGIFFNDGNAFCHNHGYIDIISAIQEKYQINFPMAVKNCADALGLPVEYDSEDYRPQKKSRQESVSPIHPIVKPKPNEEKPQQDLTDYYSKCHQNISDSKAQAYLKKRGLDDKDLIDYFNLGYDKDCNCLVIPHDKYFCTRRYLNTWTDENGREHRYKYITGSKVSLFNVDALKNEIVFITEGAINAMSIIKAGGNALALGGSGNGRLLVGEFQKIDSQPAIILLLDEDKAGQEKADKILQSLYNLKILVVKSHLPIDSESNQDVNDLLRSDGEALKKFVADTIKQIKELKEKMAEWRPEPLKPKIEQRKIKRVENQDAIDIVRNVTDFSNENIFSEDFLQAAAYCSVYAVGVYQDFKDACSKHGIRLGEIDSEIKEYAKPFREAKKAEAKLRAKELKREMAIKEKQEKEERQRQREEELQAISEGKITGLSTAEIIDKITNALERDSRGKIRANVKNFKMILENDPVIKGCIGYDSFAYRMTRLRVMPWTNKMLPDRNMWSDSDDYGLQNYIDLTYEGLRNKSVYQGVIDEVANANTFHPVRDYFDHLPRWDGVKRAETFFIEALGIEDTEYARAVSLKWLMACPARAFHPGCKFDYCLTLQGDQGIGKSTVFFKLAEQWFKELDSIAGKDAREALIGYLMIELGELQAAKKAENENIKAFISCQNDKFRLSYARRTEEFPRQCVFCGSTNQIEFIKDRTGGRRWWILECKAKENTTSERLKHLTKDFVTQVWSEVYHNYNEIFKDGFDHTKLKLPAHLENAATKIQDKYTEGSALAGQIEHFIDQQVGFYPYWNKLSHKKRREFFEDGYTFIDKEIVIKLKNASNCPKEIRERMETDLATNVGNEIKVTPERYRACICAAEIANELLGIDDISSKSRTIIEINEILKRSEKVQMIEKGVSVSGYGYQNKAFMRKAKAQNVEVRNQNAA